MTINARSTKTEILAAYREQEAILASGASWPQVWAKLKTTTETVCREFVALVKDCYAAGQATRKMYDQVVAELSQPLFKS